MRKLIGIGLAAIASIFLLASCAPTTPYPTVANNGAIPGFPAGHDLNPAGDMPNEPVKPVPDFKVEQ